MAEQTGEMRRVEPPKGSKSPFWRHFGFELDSSGTRVDPKHVQCCLCQANVGYSNNTSNLKQHLLSNHPVEYEAVVGGSGARSSGRGAYQRTLEECSRKPVAKLSPTSKRATEISEAIAEYIARDLRPIAVVEGQGFIHLLQVLEPAYQVPSRKTMKRSLVEKWEQLKSTLLRALCGAEFVTITTDFWTSLATDAYLGITAHYISENWQLHSVVLQTSEMEESHTSENVANALRDAVGERKLEEKLVATTTDNARNIVKAVRTELQWQHVPCFAHTLQIGVRAGLSLPAVSVVTARCRKVVTFFRKSPVAQTALRAKQSTCGLPQHKLIQDVVTRWNSTFEMIERILEQEQAVSAVLLDSGKRDFILSSGELAMLKSVAEVLKPLAQATTALCVEKSPSISMVQPVLTALVHKHLIMNELDSKIISDMKLAISTNLQQHFVDPELTRLMLSASALDPRYKALKILPAPKRVEVFDHLLTLSTELTSKPLELVPSPPKRPKVDDLLEFNFSSSESNGDSPTTLPSSMAEKELNLYKAEEPIGKEEDPLEWWRLNGHRFKTLAQLAKKLLCILATSVPAERLFSSAGQVVVKKRASLHPSTVDCLVFLHANL